jgi:hypothetical protein
VYSYSSNLIELFSTVYGREFDKRIIYITDNIDYMKEIVDINKLSENDLQNKPCTKQNNCVLKTFFRTKIC